MVVLVKVTYNCGCGFLSAKSKEAVAHAGSTGHTLTVAGLIKGTPKSNDVDKIIERRKKWIEES